MRRGWGVGLSVAEEAIIVAAVAAASEAKAAANTVDAASGCFLASGESATDSRFLG